MAIIRNICGVVAGAAVAQATVFACEMLGSALYPPPHEIQTFDAAQIAAWLAATPFTAKLLVVAGWALGAFAGPWVALRVTDRAWTGWVVTAVFLTACILNLFELPHPAWMALCAVILPVLAGWAAQRVHRKPVAGEALLA